MQIKKPVRANHCHVCDACVARQDHHSVWINGCIGQGSCYSHESFIVLNGCALVRWVQLMTCPCLSAQVPGTITSSSSSSSPSLCWESGCSTGVCPVSDSLGSREVCSRPDRPALTYTVMCLCPADWGTHCPLHYQEAGLWSTAAQLLSCSPWVLGVGCLALFHTTWASITLLLQLHQVGVREGGVCGGVCCRVCGECVRRSYASVL